MVEVKTVHYDQELEKIGVIADTHIPARGRFIPSQVFNLFDGVQLILHAGDLVEGSILDELQVIAPVEAVAGNMDPGHLQKRLGKVKLIKAPNISIGLLHGDLVGRRLDTERFKAVFRPEVPRAVVFGHLHEPVSRLVDGVLFFNPGSAVDPRRRAEPTCGLLSIRNGDIQGEIIHLQT